MMRSCAEGLVGDPLSVMLAERISVAAEAAQQDEQRTMLREAGQAAARARGWVSRLLSAQLSRLTAVGRRALAAVPRPIRQLAEVLGGAAWEVAAICDLFARSARERGGVFAWAGQYGALRWGVCRRSADRLIHVLEELGHLVVVDRGSRNSPREIRMHLMPVDVDVESIREARASLCREWRFELECAHRIQAAPAGPFSHPPIALSDDPFPCARGPIAPDPIPAHLTRTPADARPADLSPSPPGRWKRTTNLDPSLPLRVHRDPGSPLRSDRPFPPACARRTAALAPHSRLACAGKDA